jgi:Zn-finger nucleic acid-binding protein
MWQKCPICNGTGKTQNTSSSSSFDICSTCNGAKIISELTGLPPSRRMDVITNNLKNYTSTDFRDSNMESQQEYYGK